MLADMICNVDLLCSAIVCCLCASGKPATQLVPLLEALLQQGADVNAADDQGISALHQAAKSSPCAVLEALLTQDAAVNLQDKVTLSHNHRGATVLLCVGISTSTVCCILSQLQGKTPSPVAVERGVQAATLLQQDDSR